VEGGAIVRIERRTLCVIVLRAKADTGPALKVLQVVGMRALV
jgi:hypothetical protein